MMEFRRVRTCEGVKEYVLGEGMVLTIPELYEWIRAQFWSGEFDEYLKPEPFLELLKRRKGPVRSAG